MVWFQCEGCGDTLKKPKLASHMNSCYGGAFTCIDCSVTFDRGSVQAHTSCVTEHEKYALLATKPGGSGAQSGPPGGGNGGGGGGVAGAQFLATRPPWVCSCCNVTCTSSETLAGHAQGKKHKSKARSAEAAAAPQPQPPQQLPAQPPAAAAPPPTKRPADADGSAEQPAAKQARGGGAAGALASIKWKKLAVAALREAPGQTLKASKLRRAVLAAARAKHGAAAGDDDALAAAYEARVTASSRFVRGEDGSVSLAAGDDDD